MVAMWNRERFEDVENEPCIRNAQCPGESFGLRPAKAIELRISAYRQLAEQPRMYYGAKEL